MCVRFEFASQEIRRSEAALLLSINFFIHEENTPLGVLRIGVKRGRLDVKLNNANCIGGSVAFKHVLEPSIKKSRTLSREQKRGKSAENEAESGIGLEALQIKGSASGKRKKTRTSEDVETVADEFDFGDPQIAAGGTGDAPHWDFEARTGIPYLRGGFSKAVLGKLTVTARPWTADAIFVTRSRALWISGDSGVWPTDMTNNNAIARHIAVLLWVRQMLPALYGHFLEVQ